MNKNTASLSTGRRIGGITLAATVSLALALITLFLAVAMMAFDKGFYRQQYIRLDRPAAIGISEDELMQVTDGLIRYLVGIRPELDMQATIHGQLQPVFGQRERAHMVDVQQLFIGGIYLLAAAVLFVIVGTILSRMLLGKQHFRRIFGRTLLFTLIGVLLLLGVAGVLFYLDFDTWFTRFHLVFFSNDLWLLDPNTEVLIQMVPLEFFIASAARIGIYTAILWAALLALGAVMGRKRYIGKHVKGAAS